MVLGLLSGQAAADQTGAGASTKGQLLAQPPWFQANLIAQNIDSPRPPPETPTAATSTVEAPTAEAPTAETPTVEAPTAETRTAETPAVETPTTEISTAETPTVETPTVEAPTAETSTAETPTAETPTAEAPTTETPTVETPTVEAPTAETSTAETPTAEAPPAETPTAEAPTAETPAVEAPSSVGGGGAPGAPGIPRPAAIFGLPSIPEFEVSDAAPSGEGSAAKPHASVSAAQDEPLAAVGRIAPSGDVTEGQKTFILKIVADKDLTQLSLYLLRGDSKRVVKTICERCTTVRLNREIEALVRQLKEAEPDGAVDLQKVADSFPPQTESGQESPKKLDAGGGFRVPLWVWVAAGAFVLAVAAGALPSGSRSRCRWWSRAQD